MSNRRRLTFVDRLVVGLDRSLQVLIRMEPSTRRPNPADAVADARLSAVEKRHVAGLMRVNHAGEVAAQALYHGQALTARERRIEAALDDSAAEENDHLGWCRQRLLELDAHRSLLDPVWYAGSYVIGAAMGLAGDRLSLGFLAETERQVVSHLDGHLERLPRGDRRSRAILAQMRADEGDHAAKAMALGARELPQPLRAGMGWASKLMTKVAYWV